MAEDLDVDLLRFEPREAWDNRGLERARELDIARNTYTSKFTSDCVKCGFCNEQSGVEH